MKLTAGDVVKDGSGRVLVVESAGRRLATVLRWSERRRKFLRARKWVKNLTLVREASSRRS